MTEPRKPGKQRLFNYLTGLDIVSFDRQKERKRADARNRWQRIFAAQKVGDAGVGKFIFRPEGSVLSEEEFQRLK